jgi:hypothetical protein
MEARNHPAAATRSMIPPCSHRAAERTAASTPPSATAQRPGSCGRLSRAMASPPTDGGASSFGVDMFWLPLGARGRWLRFGGKVYEAVAALLAWRQRLDIYHSVLEVHAPAGPFVIEMGDRRSMTIGRVEGSSHKARSASQGQPPCGSSATRCAAGPKGSPLTRVRSRARFG